MQTQIIPRRVIEKKKSKTRRKKLSLTLQVEIDLIENKVEVHE